MLLLFKINFYLNKNYKAYYMNSSNLIKNFSNYTKIMTSHYVYHTLFTEYEGDLIRNIESLNRPNYFTLNIANNSEFNFTGDPFIFKHDNKYYIFSEILKNNKGKIAYTEIIKNEKGDYYFTDYKIVLDKSWHLSYPYIFHDKDDIYMLPEQGTEIKPLVLYKATNFPNEWEECITLSSHSCLDSSIFHHNGYYWIYTFDMDLNKHVILYSKELLSTKWTLHHRSSVVDIMYNKCSLHTQANWSDGLIHDNGRCGGYIFKHNGNIYRPIQINETRYGQGLQLNQIILLDTDEILEKCVLKLYDTNIHHISVCDNIIVFDYNGFFKNPLFSSSTINTLNFWFLHGDRQKQIDLYKEIGKIGNNLKILDIGYQNYNKFNKFLFNNNSIEYNVVDNTFETDMNEINASADKYILSDFFNILEVQGQYYNYYHIVISFGVLGYYVFPEEKVKKYINNVHGLLKKGGLFYLKIDNYDLGKYHIDMNYITKYFTLLREEQVHGFIFYTFQK